MNSENAPFPVASFEKLASLEASNWWFQSRNRILIWAIRTHIRTFSSYLEIGCGTGYVLEGIHKAFPSVALKGSEYFNEGLVHARKRIPSAEFTQLDATQMNAHDEHDLIGAFDVIEHIEEDQLVLNNLARALEKDGSLIVTVPQHRWLWSEVDEFACHKRRYTRDELLGKLADAGLRVEYVTSFVCLLVPLMWLSRVLSNRNKGKGPYNPESEFLIPRWLNACLNGVMKLEFGLIRLGLRLPFGGSLLAIARKG
ncbi:class I SAM-dependent methyltransferase [Pseudomonas sp. NPDC089554]|uniref:class I SAM-dependent methyltransferase n=1 Tax=Pseudomonas sp. NPDC089554 TaxID=3390653 RepID=UPI003D055D41